MKPQADLVNKILFIVLANIKSDICKFWDQSMKSSVSNRVKVTARNISIYWHGPKPGLWW